MPLHVKQRRLGQRRISHARAVSNDALIENLQAFVAAHNGTMPTRRAYSAWSKRAVSVSTVENRFGTWSRAIALMSPG